jgi:phosphoglycerate dehydrogenase-like enzyme
LKIFLDPNMLKIEYYEQTINRFSEHEFVTDINHSYDADVIVSMGNILEPQSLEQYKNLKWIALISAGYDHVDLEYLKKRNIMLTNVKDVFSIQIAEDVVSKIMFFNRNLGFHYDRQKEKVWKYKSVSHEIYGSTIGILGTGSIGQHVAKRLKAFDTKIIGYKKTYDHVPHFDVIYTEQHGLYELLKESDYVIVALPLNDHTKYLLDAKALSMMKENALLVNVARGDIIDQQALTKALVSHQIRGAALDVTSPEPLLETDPLWSLDNCFITPHNASASPKIHERIRDEIEDTIDRVLHEKELDNRII